MTTSLAMRHPLKFTRWAEVLRNQKHFDLDDFCSGEFAKTNLLRNHGWGESSLKKNFESPISRLKSLYDGKGPQSDVGGYVTWWENHLASYNPYSKAPRRYNVSLAQYYMPLGQFIGRNELLWGSGKGFNII
jgi:hypothetical protein